MKIKTIVKRRAGHYEWVFHQWSSGDRVYAATKTQLLTVLNQAQREQLGEVLSALEGKAVRLYLEDSEAFDVTIISSARAKAGGDIVGTVIWAISTTNPDVFDTGSTLHFSVTDVLKVEDLKSGQCLFDSGDGIC